MKSLDSFVSKKKFSSIISRCVIIRIISFSLDHLIFQHSDDSIMAASSTDNLEEINFNTLPTLIGSLFQADSADCQFFFPGASINDDNKVSIKAHRKLLAALSPIFSTMFNERWSHNSNGIVIKDATAVDFGTFMDYFYKGTIKLRDYNVEAIFYLAHKYRVDVLRISCVEFIAKRLNADNVIGFYTLATCFDEEGLEHKCIAYISKNTPKMLNSVEFKQCTRSTLKKILEMKEMSCKENIVFYACINWAKSMCQKKKIDDSQPKNLRTELGDCFDLIRFKEMDREQFVDIFETFPTMFTKVESDNIFMHFMRTGCLNANIRYKSVQIQLPGNVFSFHPANIMSPSITSSVRFKITKSAMLNGISFAQPRLKGTSKYLKLITHVRVCRWPEIGLQRKIILYQATVLTTDEEIYRHNIVRPFFIEADDIHSIDIDVSGLQGNIAIWRTLFRFQAKKNVLFDFHPVVDRREDMVKSNSVIAALCFEPCTDENLSRYVNISRKQPM